VYVKLNHNKIESLVLVLNSKGVQLTAIDRLEL